MEAKVRLQHFIQTVTDCERNGKEEAAFWKARERLGNYLSRPLAPLEMEHTIRPFLAKWNSYRRDIRWDQLADYWTAEMQHIARYLSASRLEDADMLALDFADDLYSRLTEIDGIRETNASKLLALSLPDLCMMWDRGIRAKYRQRLRAKRLSGRVAHPRIGDRYRDFLGYHQRIAEKLIEERMHCEEAGREESVVWLRELPSRVEGSVCSIEKPLAKLLDEYNYWRNRDKRHDS